MMKPKRIELAVIAVTLAFACFTAGFFAGRAGSKSTVNAQQSILPAVTLTQGSAPPRIDAGAPDDVVSAYDIININTATQADFMDLPGIGSEIAARIIAYRDENGSFADVTELLNVSGIGSKKLEAIMDYITAG